jgi:hypothetical protein
MSATQPLIVVEWNRPNRPTSRCTFLPIEQVQKQNLQPQIKDPPPSIHIIQAIMHADLAEAGAPALLFTTQKRPTLA